MTKTNESENTGKLEDHGSSEDKHLPIVGIVVTTVFHGAKQACIWVSNH
jgi:hypothetical protein